MSECSRPIVDLSEERAGDSHAAHLLRDAADYLLRVSGVPSLRPEDKMNTKHLVKDRMMLI